MLLQVGDELGIGSAMTAPHLLIAWRTRCRRVCARRRTRGEIWPPYFRCFCYDVPSQICVLLDRHFCRNNEKMILFDLGLKQSYNFVCGFESVVKRAAAQILGNNKLRRWTCGFYSLDTRTVEKCSQKHEQRFGCTGTEKKTSECSGPRGLKQKNQGSKNSHQGLLMTSPPRDDGNAVVRINLNLATLSSNARRSCAQKDRSQQQRISQTRNT